MLKKLNDSGFSMFFVMKNITKRGKGLEGYKFDLYVKFYAGGKKPKELLVHKDMTRSALKYGGLGAVKVELTNEILGLLMRKMRP